MCGPNESSPKPVARRARSFVLKRQPAAGLHQPDALDAYHFRGFDPFAAPAESDLGQQFSAGPHSVRAIIDDTVRFIGRGQVTWGYHIVGIGVPPSPPLNNPLELSFDQVFATLSGFVGGQEIAMAKFGNQPIAGLTLELPNEPFGIDLNVQKTFT